MDKNHAELIRLIILSDSVAACRALAKRGMTLLERIAYHKLICVDLGLRPMPNAAMKFLTNKRRNK